MTLHIKRDEEVCRAQEFVSHVQGQAHNKGLEIKSFLYDNLKPAKFV